MEMDATADTAVAVGVAADAVATDPGGEGTGPTSIDALDDVLDAAVDELATAAADDMMDAAVGEVADDASSDAMHGTEQIAAADPSPSVSDVAAATTVTDAASAATTANSTAAAVVSTTVESGDSVDAAVRVAPNDAGKSIGDRTGASHVPPASTMATGTGDAGLVVDAADDSAQATSSGRPSRAAAAADTGPEAIEKLPDGVQAGLRRLVKDNVNTVKAMLANPSTESPDNVEIHEVLARLCAGVIRQQRLSPSGFLSRFFDRVVLAEHAEVLGKSPKGGVPVLAERVANSWLRGPTFDVPRPPPKPSAKKRKADALAAAAAEKAAAKEAAKRAKLEQAKAFKLEQAKASKASKAKKPAAASSPAAKKKKSKSATGAASADATAAGDGHARPIMLPPNAPALATCARCEEMFVLSHNRHGACFGHFPDHIGYDLNCERVAKVRGRGFGAVGSIWRMPCCGKIFPSTSSDTPDVDPGWNVDLAGQGGIGGEGCFKGLCRRALERGVGSGPHSLPDDDLWSADSTFGTALEKEAYYASLPKDLTRSAPEELHRLKARFLSEDVGWSEATAWQAVIERFDGVSGSAEEAEVGGAWGVGGESGAFGSW